ncbi:MAG: hypothetical protein ACO3VO_09180 [Ilumatobacteraceae bacterium]
MHTYRGDDTPRFRKAPGVGGLYWVGDYIALWLDDVELHQLRLDLDQVDDIVNGPMQ